MKAQTDPKKRTVRIGTRQFTVPGSPASRLGLGLLLIVGGILGFLPILGFWMIPLGLVLLSVDYAPVRRFRRKSETIFFKWWRKR